jgi:hypothetical protein
VCPFQQLCQEKAGSHRTGFLGNCIEGVDPLLSFYGIGVGELVDVLIADRFPEI